MSPQKGPGADFKYYTKGLLEKVGHFCTDVQSIPNPGYLNWPTNAHKDRRKALIQLADAILRFNKYLTDLLSGNEFWVSDTVTDWAGVKELRKYRGRVKDLQTTVSSVVERDDYAVELRMVKKSVEGMVGEFEKMREDMIVRNFERASQQKRAGEGPEPTSPTAPQSEAKTKEEEAEADSYTRQRYFSLFLGGLFFGWPLINLIPRIILFAISLHIFAAAWIIKGMWIPQEPSAKETWKERVEHCPVILKIEKGPESKRKVGSPPPATAADDTPASNLPGPARNGATSPPPCRAQTDGTAADGTPTPAPRRAHVEANARS